MHLKSSHRVLRLGFTLIELLVVIAIIGVLTAMAASAYFSTVKRQQHNNSRTAVQTISNTVLQHWSEVVADAKKELIPDAAKTAMGTQFGIGPTDPRCRVIWVKLRLMEAFPQSYNEILNQNTAFWPYQVGLIPSTNRKYLPAYFTALDLARKAGAKVTTPGAGEGSACLLIALSVDRGGVKKLDRDALGGAYIYDSDGDGIDELVDGYQRPFNFYRFPTGNADLQAANPRKSAKFADPVDPDGHLANWLPANHPGRLNFEKYIHAIGNTTPVQANYVVPVLVSSGRDELFGLGPTMNVINAGEAEDNLYSFNLRQ